MVSNNSKTYSDKIIVTSNKSVKLKIILGAIVVVLVAVVVHILFRTFLSLDWYFESMLGKLFVVSLIVLWLLWAHKMWFQSVKVVYAMSDDSLISSTKRMLGVLEHMYRYDRIRSVELKVGVIDSLYGFGQIHLHLMDSPHTLIIKDVCQPKQCVRQIKSKIAFSIKNK